MTKKLVLCWKRMRTTAAHNTIPPSPEPAHSQRHDAGCNCCQHTRSGCRRGRAGLVLVAFLAVMGIAIFSDWWLCLPDDTVASYVGRQSCAHCHAGHMVLWQGSHHDLAMDLASPESVLGDFDNATLNHFGITSRMFRREGEYFVNTEGPDGEMHDYRVKYVFGVTPLQQYMVEFDRTPDMADNEVSRVQVLRLSWDTEQKRWFYLSPPDVSEKLAPNDPLHWTGSAQNWNHMCAECHSTNLQKNYDIANRRYRTTFSEIDVSCEACHGPGSTHVQLATAKSLFWDRQLGYGLAKLKTVDNRAEIHTCAKCHSRRSLVHENYHGGENFYDHYVNELLAPETYYCDGQIKDEVYVFGSFIQSKMYANNIRCTDCHNPHTAELKRQGNKLCTSCHFHNPLKYDTPAHHHHNTGSTGAQCVECHMPHAPFMDIDLRRDHGLRIPRPDHSVELQTPNACTGCHLEADRVSENKRPQLRHYADWLKAAAAGDGEIRVEINRVDTWAADNYKRWYGDAPLSKTEHVEFARTLHAAWENDPAILPQLSELAANRRVPAMIRASALSRLDALASGSGWEARLKSLTDRDPLVRGVAARNLATLPTPKRIEKLMPLLKDDVRFVRMEAALALADIPPGAYTQQQQQLIDKSLQDYRDAMLVNADQANAHMALGVLAERMQNWGAALEAYRTAIAVQPWVTGPRSNLAALLEQMRQPVKAAKYRAAELKLLARDARLAPDNGAVQYRYGLALYLSGDEDNAAIALQRAIESEPNIPEFTLGLALLFQKQERFTEALTLAENLLRLRPQNPTYQQLHAALRAAAVP